MPDATPPGDAKTLVVVGNGMVAHRLCERLVELDRAARWNVVVFGEEPRPAYDRVHLSAAFAGTRADELQLADAVWYAERSITLHLGDRVVEIDRAARAVTSERGRAVVYDALVLATGSAPFVPPIPGTTLPGVFVYRTIDDVEAIRAWSARAGAAAVIGGGLLGLEAAKAVRDLGLVTHVIEAAPRLMPRQVDARGGDVLRRAVARLGVHVHLGAAPRALLGGAAVEGVAVADADPIRVDMVVISAGIRPRDELARDAGLVVGARGGIVVDPALRTSDPAIFAVGECALANGMVYGLVGPGYAMADALAAHLTGGDATFTGADCSTN
jgi:nitrite reductase (NADH) large subunit